MWHTSLHWIPRVESHDIITSSQPTGKTKYPPTMHQSTFYVIFKTNYDLPNQSQNAWPIFQHSGDHTHL